jgi:hypothetical protein
MKRTRSLKAVVRGASISVLALLALCTMVAPKAGAKPRHSRPADPPVTIVAHLLLQEGTVTQMFVGEQKRERKWKHYLYIEQASKEGFTIVDVTNPAQPNVTNEVGWPKDASTDKLQLVGNNLALSTVREKNSGAVAALDPPTESVSVLDVSHPANPQQLYSFSGVTSVLLDDGRNLIYITNSEGLWILRHKQEPVDPCSGGCGG